MNNHKPGIAKRLSRGETVYGLLTKMSSPAIVELAGHVGFDFVVLDTEHGMAGAESLEHHLRASDAAGTEAIVRVGGPEPIETLRALDAGASGVIVPHVNDAQAAEKAVRAAHYPPNGERGLAVSTRAGRQGLSDIKDHIEHALENTMVIVQAEHAEALENISEIASSEHIDAIFLGPSDLSLSLGHPGKMDHPTVVRAVDLIVRTVVESNSAALCVLAASEEEAHSWEKRGARVILFSASALLGERLKRLSNELNLKEDTGLVGAEIHSDGRKGRTT